MAELVSKGHWSLEDKTQAAIQYAITGSLTKVEKATGIPDATVCTWKQQDWWVELVGEVRKEKAEEHRAQYSRLVDKAQKKALKLLPNTTSAKEAMLVACMATDKVRLHDGMPTSISGQSAGIQALAQQFKELSEKWDEKQVKVVDNQ